METRRRGTALEDAIRLAVLDELAVAGYAGLTMEGVARRACTGKAALYRRWRTKQDLVLDALRTALPPEADPPDADRPVREELLATLTRVADVLAGRSGFPGIDVLAEVLRVPELREAFGQRLIEPRLRGIEAVLRRAAERGEVTAAAVTPLLARIGPALVVESFLLRGTPPDPAELAEIVDSILLPLLRA
jgi:AcrR family transcriptional regulator